MINPFIDEKLVYSYWEKYIVNREPLPDHLDGLRQEVLESWKRSLKHNVDPKQVKSVHLSDNDFRLKQILNAELISIASVYVDQIYSVLKGTKSTVVLTDSEGVVLSLKLDDEEAVLRNEQSALAPAAVRGENVVGTGGISTALFLDAPLEIYSYEHYLAVHHQFYCAGHPIKHNGKTLGLLALITPKEYASAHSRAMLSVAVNGIQKELELNESLTKLELSNQRTNMILESIEKGVIILDANLNIINCNTTARSMLNLANADLDKKPFNNFVKIINKVNLNAREINISNSDMDFSTQGTKQIGLITSILKGPHTRGETIILLDRPKGIHKMVSKLAGFSAKYSFSSIIGNSPAISATKSLGMIVSKSNASILINGESGTGKELFAQAIHNASDRADGPFIAINCASIPKGLIDSELFGYAPGAFTGALKDGQAGKFELADGGTIFLDEIGDMPLDIQTSLLRVLQSHEIIRVGGKYARPVDVRVIAATHVNLQEKLLTREFRDDLFYRLNVISLQLPPLRERKSDIPLLVDYFVSLYSDKTHQVKEITPEVMQLFNYYSWPGNIRELENAIERSVILAKDGIITPDCLPESIRKCMNTSAQSNTPLAMNSIDKIQISDAKPIASNESKHLSSVHEREQLISQLISEHGDVTQCSINLGMPLRTLYRKLNKYNINPKEYRTWK